MRFLRPCLVEVGHIGMEDALELLLLKDQQVVQACLSDAPQEAFADRIGSWCVIGGPEQLDATGRRHSLETGSTRAVVISKQIVRCLPVGGGFSERYAPPTDRTVSVSPLRGSPCVIFCSTMKNPKSGRKNRSVTCKKSQAQTCAAWVRETGRPRLASWLGCANSSHRLLDGALADIDAEFQQFSANAFSSPQPIVLRHLVFSRRWCVRQPSVYEKPSLTCASNTGERAPAALASLVSGCTMKRACCHVRTSLASRTRSMRSVLVNVGRFTCRLRMMRWWRKRAFSAMSSDLLLLRSVRGESGKEVTSGFVQRAKREESACQQPFFSCWRWVKTPAIVEVSPSRKSIVVRACVGW